jgi:hypothetical protein
VLAMSPPTDGQPILCLAPFRGHPAAGSTVAGNPAAGGAMSVFNFGRSRLISEPGFD